MEGRFNGGFFALPVRGAYIWRGLYMEGLIFGILRYIIELSPVMKRRRRASHLGRFTLWNNGRRATQLGRFTLWHYGCLATQLGRFNLWHYGRLAIHPRRPRGGQSGREKRCDKSFQAQAEKSLGTDSHRTISKRSSDCRLLIGHKKCFVLLCPIGEQHLLSSFREFVHDGD